jgi:hypothetical protein
MLIPCFCDKCRGTLISTQTRLNHQRRQLKTTTMLKQQLKRKPQDTLTTQPSASPLVASTPLPSPSGVSAPPLVASLSISALDNVNPEYVDPCEANYATPEFFASSDVNPKYTDLREDEYVQEASYEFPDLDGPLDDADLGDADISMTSTPALLPSVLGDSGATEDDHDPFVVESSDHPNAVEVRESGDPAHLLVAHAVVAWLHF